MGRVVLDEDGRVCAWIDDQMRHPHPSPPKASIGYERNGTLVAAVMFDNLTDNNVFAHIASRAVIFPIELLKAVALYVFHQLNVGRVTFMVHADNARCIRFVEKMGARLEARLERGTSRSDTLLYVLWRDTGFHARLKAAGRI